MVAPRDQVNKKKDFIKVKDDMLCLMKETLMIIKTYTLTLKEKWKSSWKKVN